jgi:hypothetical protein
VPLCGTIDLESMRCMLDISRWIERLQKCDHNEYYTDKKENQIFLKFPEIQKGAVAKLYMTNGLLIYG